MQVPSEASAGVDTAAADSWKAKGNEYYKAGSYQQAIDAYSKAIDANPSEAVFYGNRAAAHLMRKSSQIAVNDCKRAIELDAKYLKGYQRGAKAALAMVCYELVAPRHGVQVLPS